MILTNADGQVLDSVGDAAFAGRAAQIALMPGAGWSEAMPAPTASARPWPSGALVFDGDRLVGATRRGLVFVGRGWESLDSTRFEDLFAAPSTGCRTAPCWSRTTARDCRRR